jgi:hypothetical protein
MPHRKIRFRFLTAQSVKVARIRSAAHTSRKKPPSQSHAECDNKYTESYVLYRSCGFKASTFGKCL